MIMEFLMDFFVILTHLEILSSLAAFIVESCSVFAGKVFLVAGF